MTHEQEGAAGRLSHPTGLSAVWRVTREPAMLAIVAAGLIHVIRRDATDVLVFFGMFAVTLLDDARLRRGPGSGVDGATGAGVGRPPPRLVCGLSTGRALAVCALYALMALPLARTGWGIRLLVVVPGLVALLVVIRSGRSPLQDEQPGPPLGAGWLLWPAVALALLLFELANFMSQVDPNTDNPRHPTLSAIVEPLLAGAVPRAVFAALWLAAGIWLVRTITMRPGRGTGAGVGVGATEGGGAG